jgi:hypothetical protein
MLHTQKRPPKKPVKYEFLALLTTIRAKTFSDEDTTSREIYKSSGLSQATCGSPVFLHWRLRRPLAIRMTRGPRVKADQEPPHDHVLILTNSGLSRGEARLQAGPMRLLPGLAKSPTMIHPARKQGM